MLDGGCTLKLTGGCITDCHATGTGGGGVNSRDSGAILYMSGTARIENCTAKWSSANAIVNSGTMYADGGTVDGTINNQGKIKRSDAATDVTVFKKAVYNRPYGSIEAGIYKGTVENMGTITGGTFYGSIVNEVGPEQVTGGTFAVTFDIGDGTKTEPTLVKYSDPVPERAAPHQVGPHL